MYDLIDKAFPEEHFKPWEFISAPVKYWNKETVKGAIEFLLLEKYKVTANHIKDVVNYKTLQEEGLGTLAVRYGISYLTAIAESIFKEQVVTTESVQKVEMW